LIDVHPGAEFETVYTAAVTVRGEDARHGRAAGVIT
jgi:hypothetical protein